MTEPLIGDVSPQTPASAAPPPGYQATAPRVQYVPGQQQQQQQPIANASHDQQTVVVFPVESQPSHHLTMTVVITLLCLFLNVTSLMIGIPAVAVAVGGYRSSRLNQPAATKILGYVALVMNIMNIVYTAVLDIIIIGVVSGHCTERYRYSSYIDITTITTADIFLNYNF